MNRTSANDPVEVKPILDPAKMYRFTWPGQPQRVISGAELAAICKGANADMLAIEEVTVMAPAPQYPPPMPSK